MLGDFNHVKRTRTYVNLALDYIQGKAPRWGHSHNKRFSMVVEIG